MSATATMTTPAAVSTPTDAARPPASRLLPATYQTIDGLLRSHAAESCSIPLVAYPVEGVNDFEVYDAKDLDRFTDAAVASYISHGVQPADPALPEAPVIALLAPSSIEYYVTFMALNRMGYAVLFLSTRLPPDAYISLMKMSDCSSIIVSPSFGTMAGTIHETWPCQTYPLLLREEYRHIDNPPKFNRPNANPLVEGKKLAWIVHSSGSTGFPKSIPLTNMQCLANFYKGLGLKTFCVSPLFHSQALNECGRALYAKKSMWLGNFAFPVTTQNLVEAMSVAKPELFIVVPYVLKLMSESAEGLAQLRNTLLVKYGGSACPDALGDKLVAEGVNLVGNYGATETGFIMDSFRPPGDTEWAYLRLQDSIGKHVLMDEISPGVFECVGLDGLPSKGPSNSDDPPNSFRTRDLFTRHPDPAKSNYYKYLSRLDDRLTLVNSEKVLPLPIEGRIRQDLLVGEAAVFGAGHSVPGVIVFRNAHSAHLSDADFLSAIQPSIDAANAAAESFSRIPQELIIPMPADKPYPKTDKGTFIRAQLYQVFATEIEAAYSAFESSTPTASAETQPQELSIPELEAFLMTTFANTLNTPLPSTTADIFSCGVDSLQTTRLYSIIRRTISLGPNTAALSSNVVFEQGTVAALARHLFALRTTSPTTTSSTPLPSSSPSSDDDAITQMQDLIATHSTFPAHSPPTPPLPDPASPTILLTGATGSLGAYTLASLLRSSPAAKIFALVRAPDPATATARVLAQLQARDIPFCSADEKRLVCLPCDLAQENLGLQPDILEQLRRGLTHVIHAAWPVNFNVGLAGFEGSLRGVRNLIALCRSTQTRRPAAFWFCSSVSVASRVGSTGGERGRVVRETRMQRLQDAQATGYGRGKACAEWIALAAGREQRGGMVEKEEKEEGVDGERTGMVSRVLRVGQLGGDLRSGRWNATEAIPLLIRCAVQEGIRCLPRLDEMVSWLPVDVAGEAVVALVLGQERGEELSRGQSGMGKEEGEGEGQETVYQVLNPTRLHFTYDVLPALRKAYEELLPGTEYDEVEPQEWLTRLRVANEQAFDGDNEGATLAERNPCIKLLGFWEGKYKGEAGAPPRNEGAGPGSVEEKGLRFETTKTLEDAPVLGSAGKDVMLQEGVDGYFTKLIRSWLAEWKLD